MRKTLIQMLVVVAIGVAGITLSRVEQGVPVAELVDAGILNCPPVDLACDVRASSDWVAQMAPTGANAGARYRRVAFDARDCRSLDAGFVITDKRFYRDGGAASGWDVVDSRCRIVPDAPDAGDGVREMPVECGCRMASGICRYQIADGGLVAAPLGVTLGPGYPPYETFGGAGCARKACVELAGESSWPEVCPK